MSAANTAPARHTPEPKPAQAENASLPQLLHTQEAAAQMLSLGITTIRELTASGELPCRRIGRAVPYTLADLQFFVDCLENHPYRQNGQGQHYVAGRRPARRRLAR